MGGGSMIQGELTVGVSLKVTAVELFQQRANFDIIDNNIYNYNR